MQKTNLVAILLKEGHVSAIAVDTRCQAVLSNGSTATFHQIGRYDCRAKPAITINTHDTARSAVGRFYDSLAISRENGWAIAYCGRRNHG